MQIYIYIYIVNWTIFQNRRVTELNLLGFFYQLDKNSLGFSAAAGYLSIGLESDLKTLILPYSAARS